ncbi:hypothetical protein GGX14DRAFT_570225 [Mycena pura]|uniref:Uncharacterized protein n=1 Tax=Mycena pura TaxID=153505 RepID=A0AAD6V9F3_9AGAR|nr:hypothetical protein GGX14DRAFT_570225 [Mycena pura]
MSFTSNQVLNDDVNVTFSVQTELASLLKPALLLVFTAPRLLGGSRGGVALCWRSLSLYRSRQAEIHVKNIKISFPPPLLPAGVTLAPCRPPAVAQSPPLSPEEKKERDLVASAVEKFADRVYLVEQRHPDNQHRPKSSYFPSVFREALAEKLLFSDSLSDVHALVSSWIFAASHAGSLYDLVVELQATIRSDRNTARLKKNAKQRASRTTKQVDADDVDEEAEEGEESESADDEHSPPSSPAPPPAKRSKTVHHTVLEDVTNQSRSKRRAPSSRKPTQKGSAKASPPTVASITADFGPAYRTTSDCRRTARGG